MKTIYASLGGPNRSDARRAQAAVRTLALCSLALAGCLPSSLSLGDDTTEGSGDTSPTEMPPDLPPSDSTSTGAADATTTDGSSDDTGADVCPQGPSGWQWIERRGTEDGTELYTFIDLLPDDGGVIVLGDMDRDPFFPVLRRYDVWGELQWEQQGDSGYQVEDVLAMPNGDIVVCGQADRPGSHLWLARYDAMGNEQWSADEPNLYCRAVNVTASGDIVAGGMVNGSEVPEGETAVLRFDASGALVGSWIADVPATFGIQRMVTVGEEVVMLAEYSGSSGYWLGRLGADDQLLWGESHFDDRGPYSRAGDVAVGSATGELTLVGVVEPRIGGPSDMAMWRFSADGIMQWEVLHDLGGPWDSAGQVRIAPDGTFVVAGLRVGRTTQPLVAALDPDGELLWWTSLVEGDLEGADPLFVTNMELDDCGAIYLSGWGEWEDDPDGWVGRYLPEDGI